MAKRRDRWRADGSGSNVGQHTARQAGDFLFDLGPEDGEDEDQRETKALDQRTRVKGKNIMSALAFYDILYLGFEAEAAKVVGDTLKRLLIGYNGEGREEATIILRQSLPKEIEIETGIA